MSSMRMCFVSTLIISATVSCMRSEGLPSALRGEEVPCSKLFRKRSRIRRCTIRARARAHANESSYGIGTESSVETRAEKLIMTVVDPTSRFLTVASGDRGWQGESTKTVLIHDVKW